MLATDADPAVRNGGEAVRLAERACAANKEPRAVDFLTLAAALAEAGRFREAIGAAERARLLAAAKADSELEKRSVCLRELFRSGKAYREP